MRNEAADVEPAGEIVLFQKLDDSSRKFDDMPDWRASSPRDTVRCGSHHIDCLSAQRAFQYGDKASSPEIDSGSTVTDSTPVPKAVEAASVLGSRARIRVSRRRPGNGGRCRVRGEPGPCKALRASAHVVHGVLLASGAAWIASWPSRVPTDASLPST